jgi:protein tyrosine phosphatse n18, putative
MSLKVILKNFLNHFENLESRRKSAANGEEDLYTKEFISLKELTESLKVDHFYSYNHGLKDVNRRKNRYKDILPCRYLIIITQITISIVQCFAFFGFSF